MEQFVNIKVSKEHTETVRNIPDCAGYSSLTGESEIIVSVKREKFVKFKEQLAIRGIPWTLYKEYDPRW